MEISGSSLNQPVNFYTKNTGNTINMAIDNENISSNANIFASEFSSKSIVKNQTSPIKRKRKNKRLNTIDTDYLPDEAEETSTIQKAQTENFFIKKEEHTFNAKLKKALNFFITSTPLINYFFLKQKKQKLEKTVATLNDINQNVDELMNTTVPFGEESHIYTDIAKNLTDAASLLGKVGKNI